MIQFVNINKYYASDHWALQNISFIVPEGELVFLTGHSGAGKTTLLKLIMMNEVATRGQILINNHTIEGRPHHQQIATLRKDMGIVFQNPLLLKDRTLFDNVALPLIVSGSARRDITKRVRAALDKVGLLHKENQLPASLSCGEQQRAGIARAVVNKPKILLADEPTGNLDPALSQDIMMLFEAFQQVGVTIIIATHDWATVAAARHHVMILKDGQLVSTRSQSKRTNLQ